jgi:hypothetical protein
MHILNEEEEMNGKCTRNYLLKNATNGMKVTQRPMRPSAARQQIQVRAPPKPPNNPPRAPAPARSGGGNGALKHYIPIVILRKKKKIIFTVLCSYSYVKMDNDLELIMTNTRKSLTVYGEIFFIL